MSPRVSRRRFLSAAACSAVAATSLGRGLARAADPFGKWPLGAQSYSLREFTLEEAVRHLRGLGLRYVELFNKHLAIDASEEVIRQTQALVGKAGITISAHGVNGFTADHAKNRAVFEFARRAGLRTITANPQPDSFDSLEKLVAEFDVRIAIHNHGPDALYDTIESVKRAVDGRHPLIGACVDTGHFIRSKEDPVEAVRALGPRVFAAHIKDEAKREKRSHNVVIGSGHLDVVGLFRALKEVGFPSDGALSLEYEANPDNPIDDMRQCLEVAREAIAQVG